MKRIDPAIRYNSDFYMFIFMYLYRGGGDLWPRAVIDIEAQFLAITMGAVVVVFDIA